MTITTRSALLCDLLALRQRDKDGYAIQSICHEIAVYGGRHFAEKRILLERLFVLWPKVVGRDVLCLSYPIPDPAYRPSWEISPAQAAREAYIRASRSGLLWKGPYGDLRRELLDHCITELEKQDAYQHSPR